MRALINVPLPTLSSLGSAIVSNTQSYTKLSAPWQRSGDTGFWFSRSAWSLLAIAQCWQRLKGKTSITIFVPDFFCNASLAPLRSIGVQLRFYPITDEMAPDFDVCRNMAEEASPDLFVIVHYFGNPNLAETAAVFCRERKAWLIEDAAHVLRPIAGIGEYGDFVLYSPHKLLPIPDGAVLLMRENGPGLLMTQASARIVLQDVYSALINTPKFSNAPSRLWLFKRVLQRIGIRNWRSIIFPFFQDIDTIDSELEHPKPSSLTKRLLSCLVDTLDSVASMRVQNSVILEDLLANSDLFKAAKWPASIDFTPYLLELTFYDDKIAENVFLQCQRIGLPVTTWPDLPPEVIARKDHHCNALLFRNTRIYLQVHQSLKLSSTHRLHQQFSI